MSTVQTISLNKSIPNGVIVKLYDDGQPSTLSHTVNNSETGEIVVTFPSWEVGSYRYRVFHQTKGYVLREGIYVIDEEQPTKTFQSLTDGATITWNIEDGYNATVTLGGNRTLSITNAVSGDSGTLIVKQDAVGSRTLTLPSGSKEMAGSITLSTAANSIDIIAWLYDGTNYYWNFGGAYA